MMENHKAGLASGVVILLALALLTVGSFSPGVGSGSDLSSSGSQNTVQSEGSVNDQAATTNATTDQEPSEAFEVGINSPSTAIDDQVLRLSASHEAKTDVSYTWSQTAGPDVPLMDADSPFPWLVTPDVHSQQTLRFRVVISNGATEETASTTVTVEPNESPAADISGDIHVTEDDSILLDGTDSADPDGDELRYEWSQSSGPEAEMGVTDAGTLAITAPRVSEPTELSFTLTVVDRYGQRDDVQHDIIVYPDPDTSYDHASADDTILGSDDTVGQSEEGPTHYQVDLVRGEPLTEFGAARSDGFYNDQERLVQWLWGSTSEPVTDRGRPRTLDEATEDCVDSSDIGVEDGTASVRVTVSNGCAVELSLVAYIKPGPGFDRQRASEQELYDATTSTVGPGTYTYTVAVPEEE